MNYMEQIAKMLGVELEEEFKIAGDDSKYRITERGLEYVDETIGDWMIEVLLYRILNGTYEITKIPKPILDEAEKEYLSAVINPFRDCVKCIFKNNMPNYEYIVIEYCDKPNKEKDEMLFPSFEKGTMYKGMELSKHYTLEELGL